MARIGRKRVSEALRSVQADLPGVTQGTNMLLRGSGMQYPANKRVREMMAAGSGQEGGCNLISLLDQCDVSPQSGSALSRNKSSGNTTEVCSRLRPFEVAGIKSLCLQIRRGISRRKLCMYCDKCGKGTEVDGGNIEGGLRRDGEQGISLTGVPSSNAQGQAC